MQETSEALNHVPAAISGVHKAHDLFSFFGALIISLVSGFISIAQRIVRGAAVSCLWIASEVCAVLLCGYLTYDVYPIIQPQLPDWCTLWVAISVSAYMGSRVLQTLESWVYRRTGINKPE